VFNQGLAQPTSDNNQSVHAPYWCMNILKLVRLTFIWSASSG